MSLAGSAKSAAASWSTSPGGRSSSARPASTSAVAATQPLSSLSLQATEQYEPRPSRAAASPSSAAEQVRLGKARRARDRGRSARRRRPWGRRRALARHSSRTPARSSREQAAPRRALRGVAGGQLREPLLPETRALELGRQRVELLERRVDAGLDRELAQQAPGEAVDGADGRVVESVERALDDRGARGVAAGALRQPLELLADALAQLAGRLLGERDGRHRAHVPGAAVGVEHAAHVAVDEHARLAGAGPGLQQVGRARGRW